MSLAQTGVAEYQPLLINNNKNVGLLLNSASDYPTFMATNASQRELAKNRNFTAKWRWRKNLQLTVAFGPF